MSQSPQNRTSGIWQSFKQAVDNFVRSTSHEQLVETLYPFENSLPSLVDLKEDYLRRSRDESLQASKAARDSFQTSQKAGQAVQQASAQASLQAVQLAIQASQQAIQASQEAIEFAQQTILASQQTLFHADQQAFQLVIEACQQTVQAGEKVVQDAQQASVTQDAQKAVNAAQQAYQAAHQASQAAAQAAIAAEQAVQQVADQLAIGKKAPEMAKKAEEAIGSRQIQEGWEHYYQAYLASYQLLGEKTLRARAMCILNSVENLDDEEKKTVQELIGQAREKDGTWELKTNLNREEIIAAQRTVQAHYTSAYTKLGMVLRQLAILGAVALVLTGAVIFSLPHIPNANVISGNFTATNFTAANVTGTDFTAANFAATNVTVTGVTAIGNAANTSLYFLLSVAIFGALGGTFSAMLALAKGSTGDVPERLLNSWLTLAKPIVGAVAAIAVFVFLLGGIIQALNITNYLIFAFAFISGFSERIILGAITERETGTEKKS